MQQISLILIISFDFFHTWDDHCQYYFPIHLNCKNLFYHYFKLYWLNVVLFSPFCEVAQVLIISIFNQIWQYILGGCDDFWWFSWLNFFDDFTNISHKMAKVCHQKSQWLCVWHFEWMCSIWKIQRGVGDVANQEEVLPFARCAFILFDKVFKFNL
jgi:hypothetical protein